MNEHKSNILDENKSEIQTLQSWIDECDSNEIVFFGGAGVSTESGVPDFRSVDGLYAEKYKYPPETIISHSFFMQHCDEFYEYYCSRMLPTDESIKPNDAHLYLAELEAAGKLAACVTQNIDGLHQAASSKNVLELHGSVLRNNCMTCNKFFDMEEMLSRRAASSDGVPHCDNGSCNGIIKPDVVLYEEPLDNNVMRRAIATIAKAKLMIVAGTSLAVYPAAGLLDYFHGDYLCIINRAATPRDRMADLCIQGSVGEICSCLSV